MSRWKEIWTSRQVNDSPATLAGLIALDGFDTGAGRVSETAWRDYVRTLAGHLDLVAGESIFEVGCGAGALLKVFQEVNHTVAGIDYSDSLIKHARMAMPGMCFAVAEARTLTGPARDYVIANSVFSYFPDLDYARDVIERMQAMASKGLAILDVPDVDYRVASEAARCAALPAGEYEARYRGLEHRYYTRDWLAGTFPRSTWRTKITDQWLAGYGNARFRFNLIAQRIA